MCFVYFLALLLPNHLPTSADLQLYKDCPRLWHSYPVERSLLTTPETRGLNLVIDYSYLLDSELTKINKRSAHNELPNSANSNNENYQSPSCMISQPVAHRANH